MRYGVKKIWTSGSIRDMYNGRYGSKPSALTSDSYSYEVLLDTPKLFWKCQEASGNLQDSSGGGFNADTSFGSIGYRSVSGPGAGPFGTDYALRLGGAAAVGGFSRSAQVSSQRNPWTLELWLYITTPPGTLDSVLCGNSIRANNNSGGGTGGYEMSWPSTGTKLHAGFPNVGDEPDFTNAVGTGAWKHVAITKDTGTGGTVKYYLAGAVDNAAATTDNPASLSTTSTVKIGCNFGGNYDIYVAYFALYETALSAARIAAHAAAVTP